jgi:hypothetical protein
VSRGRGAVPVERDPLPKVVLACLLVMAGGLLLVVAVRPLPGAALVVGRGRVDADRLTAHRVTVLRGSLLAPVPPDKPVRPIPSFQVAADALTVRVALATLPRMTPAPPRR